MQNQSNQSMITYDVKHTTISLIIYTNKIIYVIDFEDIMYLKSSGCYSYIFQKKNSNVILVCKTLKDLYNFLPKSLFFRCHHSYIINRTFVEFVKISQKTVVLIDNTQIPISRRKYSDFRKFLQFE